MRSDFCVFILTHGRPDRVITYRTLRRQGYEGPIRLVIDDEDKAGEAYRKHYGSEVVTFSKSQVAKFTDQFDTFPGRTSVLWARNACWALAERLGFRFFMQLDDDYATFSHRGFGCWPGETRLSYGERVWRQGLGRAIEALIRFLESTPALTVAMSQGGDHFAHEAAVKRPILRKAMNSFVCDTHKPFLFRGRFNEDVNTYISLGAIGKLLFTYMPLQLHQLETQTNPGGASEMYMRFGTYVKSFYTVMAAPSCTTVRLMGRSKLRLHHSINWNAAVPKIVSERLRRSASRAADELLG